MRLLWNAIILFILVPYSGFTLEVSATIAPIYSLLSGVTKGVLEPSIIINNTDASPHDYVLTPKAVQLIKRSDVIFYVSNDLEQFAKKNALEYWVELLPLMPTIINKPHGQKDVHIWLNPGNAIEIVKIMVSTLSEKDVENAKIYKRNGNKLINEINVIIHEMEKINVLSERYIVVHDAYDYFTQYFNIPAGIKLTHNDQHSVGAKSIRALQKTINNGIACVILDPLYKVNVPEKVFQHTKVVMLDPLGKGTYQELLRSTLNAFRECFE